MIRLLFYAAAGSALGGALRFGINQLIQKDSLTAFPWHTFLINISGCLLIGWLFSFSKEQELIGENTRIFLMTGFCGGFTTFSAFSLENLQLIQNGQSGRAIMYMAASFLLGLLMTWIGMIIGRPSAG